MNSNNLMPFLNSKKKLVVALSIAAILTGGFFGYKALGKNEDKVQYRTQEVTRGSLIVTVSGSGQVSSSQQLDVSPKVSGDIVNINVEKGQEVSKGDLLMVLDIQDAQSALRDAETNLETAELELEELLSSPDDYELMKTENALAQAKNSLAKLKTTQASEKRNTLDAIRKAEDNLEQSYEDAFNKIADAFLDLPSIISGLEDILYSYEIGRSEKTISSYNWNITALVNSVSLDDRGRMQKYINSAEEDYEQARKQYDQNFENYKTASRFSEEKVIEDLLTETIAAAKSMAEAVKSATNVVDSWVDFRTQNDYQIFAAVNQYQSDLQSYTSKTNSHLSSLLGVEESIEDAEDAKQDAQNDLVEIEQNHPIELEEAEQNIEEKEQALAELKAGADEMDIRKKKIEIQQKEDALLEARQDIADHYIRAPFSGIVAEVDVEEGETVSSNTACITLISDQKTAELTLNEVDAVKVETGQKAILSFDAIEDLEITGEVAGVDTIGAVQSGVVSYGVDVVFDTQDARVKPGMTIVCEIITKASHNTFMVPNSAVQYQGDDAYVNVLSEGSSPVKKGVKIGISNATETEILSGLTEGEKVITQEISSVTAGASSESRSGPGGAMFRMMR